MQMCLIRMAILSIWVICAQGGCPSKCNCTEESLICTSKSLTEVPYLESLPHSPTIIDFTGNALAMIKVDDFSFDKGGEVREVYLNNSGIFTVEEGAFAELPKLQELYLGENLLKSVPEALVQHNVNMLLLEMSGNLFEEMPKVRSNSLAVLTLAYSTITTVDQDALVDLPNLRVLHLQQNNIKTIHPSTFERSNRLFVLLTFNPWRCDCETVELFDYLLANKMTEISATTTIQCQTRNRNLFDIYNEHGAENMFQNWCNHDKIDRHLLEDLLESGTVERPALARGANDDVQKQVAANATESNFLVAMFLFVTLPVTFFVGVLLGSYVTYKYMFSDVKPNAKCTKKLLTPSV